MFHYLCFHQTFYLRADSSCHSYSLKRTAVFIAVAALAFIAVLFNPFLTSRTYSPPRIHAFDSYKPVRPALSPTDKNRPDPVRWLLQNSNNKYSISRSILPSLPAIGAGRRPRAAIISLVRNSELRGMMQSIRQLEYSWNSKYQVNVFKKASNNNSL
jgi:hypothetical protein